jgi:hypothetical protein
MTPAEYIAYLRGLAAERRKKGFSGDAYEWRASQLERKEQDRIAAVHADEAARAAWRREHPDEVWQQPAEEPSIGRPRHSGGYWAQDKPLVTEMRKLYSKKVVTSIAAAARKVVHKAAGDGDEVSKIKRLVKRYAERFGRIKKQKSRSRKSGK